MRSRDLVGTGGRMYCEEYWGEKMESPKNWVVLLSRSTWNTWNFVFCWVFWFLAFWKVDLAYFSFFCIFKGWNWRIWWGGFVGFLDLMGFLKWKWRKERGAACEDDDGGGKKIGDFYGFDGFARMKMREEGGDEAKEDDELTANVKEQTLVILL